MDSSQLSVLAETGLLPLWGRHLWHQNPALQFKDPFAETVVAGIEYDFSDIDKRIGEYGIALWGNRSVLLDRKVRDHLRTSPDSHVVSLGVGLDDPMQRVDNGTASFIDCDFPGVLDFRDHFLPPSPRRTIHRGSFFETPWIDEIIQSGNSSPIICFAGVSMYLKENQLQTLLNTISQRLPGATIAFDCLSRMGIFVVNQGMRYSALPQEKVHWGFNGIPQLRSWVGDNHTILCHSLFQDLPGPHFKWRTRLAVILANLVGMAQIIVISPRS